MSSTDTPARDGHQSPAAIRDETFERRFRGLDADRVYAYLDLLAHQVQAGERELDEARAENRRLRTEVQRGQEDLRRVQAELDEYEQVGERVNEQMVQLFSEAQLVAEEMVEEVNRDARERIGQARAHERKIVEGALDAAGEQVRSYARSAQAQMQSVMDSFAGEVDRLGRADGPDEPDEPDATRRTPDPLLDDWVDWQRHHGRHDGQGAPGKA